MRYFGTLLKMNMKLLLRNKGFIFFLCFAPIICVFVLSLNIKDTEVIETSKREGFVEWTDSDEKIIYEQNATIFTVKVFDKSQSELSDYVLEQMSKSGMFMIFRFKASGLDDGEILKQAENDAFEDRIGTIVCLKENFDKAVLNGDYENALQIYDVSEDGRRELFFQDLGSCLDKIHQTVLASGMLDKNAEVGEIAENVIKILSTLDEVMPVKHVVSLESKKNLVLTPAQQDDKELIGYSLAIITLGFLFCGICVSYTVTDEKDNKVYTRILLTRARRYDYLLSKLAMSLIISAAQTIIMGVCMFVLKDIDFGVNKFSFLFLIFLIGIIFSLLSLCIGVLIGDVMGANYAVFTLWCVSALIAGVYFPIDDSSAGIKTLSYLMPQKWFLKASEMIMTSDKTAYSMILCITAAYLIVIVSISAVGLKLKRED